MFKKKRLYSSFYFDEDVSVVVARVVRAHGFDVACTSEVGLRSKTDEDQLKFAVKEGRILVTHNIKDFINLHNYYMNKRFHHCGIILAVRRKDNYDFAKRLLGLLQQIESSDLKDQIRFI